MYEAMPHGADKIAAYIVLMLCIPVVFQLRDRCLLGLQESLREAMLHVGFEEADVRGDDGSRWDLHDETLISTGILLLVFTAIK